MGHRGTVPQSNYINLTINVLNFDRNFDNTTIFPVSNNPNDITLQHVAARLISWLDSGMIVNSSKSKEMITHFKKNYSLDSIAPICTDDNFIERNVLTVLNYLVFSSDHI